MLVDIQSFSLNVVIENDKYVVPKETTARISILGLRVAWRVNCELVS